MEANAESQITNRARSYNWRRWIVWIVVAVVALLIHSIADLLVPITNAEQLKQAAPHAETWWAPDAKHAGVYNTHRETYIDKVIAFFDRSLE
jgi:fermentation-respiration switch protein FrsA (DUF1100 family)